jgi:imidazolonepropionase-like amidohydrolase
MSAHVPAVVLAAALSAGSLALLADSQPEVIVRGIAVVDVAHGQLLPAHDIVVRGTRIDRLVPAGAPLPAAKTSIDGRGKYAVPGLIAAPVRLAAFTPPTLQTLLAAGLTAVGDAGTDAAQLARWRRDLATGRLYAPRLAERCGPNAGTAASSVSPATPDALHDELARAVARGRTPAEALRAATLEAASALCLDSGRVTAGAPADFLVLSANPLADIRHSRAIDAVVFRGEVFTYAHLQMLRRGALALPTPPAAP